MDPVSIRSITGDIARLACLYEKATGVPASWSSEDFAELRTTCATLVIGSTRTAGHQPTPSGRQGPPAGWHVPSRPGGGGRS